MTLTINNQTLLFCFLIFSLFAFIAYLFKRSNLFFKMVLFIPFFSLLAWLEAINKIVVTICAIVGVAVIYYESFLNFFYVIKMWIENTFYGFFSMIRRILQLIFFPIADFFTWFYNLLSRTFGWNLVFHKLSRPREEQYAQQKADRPRRDKQSYHKGESSRKPEPGRDRDQKRDTKHQDNDYQGKRNHDQSRDTKAHQQRSKDEREQRKARPEQSQSSRNGKSDYQSDKKSNSSNQKPTGDKKVSPEEQAKQDAINKAREEVKRAREQAKRKEEQQDDNNSGGGRSYQQILGLSDNYSLADLMKAYKLAVSRYHPDKYSHMSESFQKEAQAEFVKVKKAYNELVKNFN